MPCDESDISFPAGTIGLVVPFVLLDNGVPISNAVSATVTWIAQNGVQRLLSLSSPVSAVFTYRISANDSRTAHTELGYLMVSYGSNAFPTGVFTVNVTAHF